jgi:uncharacterized small protein (TIGR04563 family)
MARGSKAKADGAAGGPGERQSLYFPKEMLDEIKQESLDQDRSLSWLIQQAWAISRLRVSGKGKQTLLDAWILKKGWTLEAPALDQITGTIEGEPRRKG